MYSSAWNLVMSRSDARGGVCGATQDEHRNDVRDVHVEDKDGRIPTGRRQIVMAVVAAKSVHTDASDCR